MTVSVPPLAPPVNMYHMPPAQPPPNIYGQMPNGYSGGPIPPPGIPRYPTTYTPMIRPTFPPRPPGTIGMLQPLVRPPVPGIRGVPPVATAVVRPVVPIVAPTEKPQTIVYIGKIASTVENDFILSLLRLCGPVKSWKRAQDPSNGTPRAFGLCEFESAEGVLRALRLLSKFSVDGQELTLNVSQATKEYLERYVEKKTEREKLKEIEAEGTKKEEEGAPGVEKDEASKPPAADSKVENATGNKETPDSSSPNFGVVSDDDREADRDALEKLQNMLEERLKTKPLPPPPTQPPPDVSAKSNSGALAKSGDGDSDVDIMKNGDDKIDDEMTSENKHSSEHDLHETSSPDRTRRYDRRSRERDRDRDLKREKERELERYERERERERVRREREREMKMRDAERIYNELRKEWEVREKDKELERRAEKDKEKNRERQRRREIVEQEDESDDDDRKRRRRSSVLEEKKKKRKREKEEDMADRLREEEEIAEAKKKELEEQLQKQEEAKHVSSPAMNGSEKSVLQEEATIDRRSNGVEHSYESDSVTVNHSDDVIMKYGVDDDSPVMPVPVADTRQSSNAPTRKLGFGLVGSGKRTTVPSVFHEEDEDDEDKDKKMRPLVPIDYSTEELQAVQTPTSGTPPPNLAAAAEFAKRISSGNAKDERSETERDRYRRPSDRSSHRERERNDEDRYRARDEYKEKNTDRDREREHAPDKHKAQENKKLLDAKQLIDMIPKTKEELFSYEINWAVYDKHELQERMRPWISKKITEFLGEEETTLVDYIVSKTKDHVRASEMLELLQLILDDEAEMFVLKMWRMLIFEIKKVETGLAQKPKA